MAIKLDLVGKKSAPLTHKYSWRDTVLYALGVGAQADEIDFLFEMNGPKVLPTFAVVPSFNALIAVTSNDHRAWAGLTALKVASYLRAQPGASARADVVGTR